MRLSVSFDTIEGDGWAYGFVMSEMTILPHLNLRNRKQRKRIRFDLAQLLDP